MDLRTERRFARARATSDIQQPLQPPLQYDAAGSVLSFSSGEAPKAAAARRSARSVALSHLGMTFVGLSFGLWNVLASSLLGGKHGPPAVVFGLVRAAGSTPLLLLLAAVLERPAPMWRLPAKDLGLLAALGFVNGVGDIGCYLLGLQLVVQEAGEVRGAAIAAIFQPLTPVACCTLAVLFRLERVTLPKIIGMALGVGGALVMIGWPLVGGSSSGGGLWGDLVLGGGVFFGAVGVLQQKPLHVRYKPAAITAYSFVFSTIMYGLVSLYYLVPLSKPGRDPTTAQEAFGWVVEPSNLAIIAYAVLICSFVNYYILCFANRHLDGTVITLYAPIQPLVTVIAAYVRCAHGEQGLGGASGCSAICRNATAVHHHANGTLLLGAAPALECSIPWRYWLGIVMAAAGVLLVSRTPPGDRERLLLQSRS